MRSSRAIWSAYRRNTKKNRTRITRQSKSYSKSVNSRMVHQALIMLKLRISQTQGPSRKMTIDPIFHPDQMGEHQFLEVVDQVCPRDQAFRPGQEVYEGFKTTRIESKKKMMEVCWMMRHRTQAPLLSPLPPVSPLENQPDQPDLLDESQAFRSLRGGSKVYRKKRLRFRSTTVPLVEDRSWIYQ
jgi:hypothetical protein